MLNRSSIPKLIFLALAFNSWAGEIRFNRDVKPLLSENCFSCHGPDASSRKAGLRLDLRDAPGAAVESGVIVPGNAAKSELIERITSSDPDEVMPPLESHGKLTQAEKALLKQWVDEGAPWEEHWAFIPPEKSAIPYPAGIDQWARNAIDHFVLEKLIQSGLEPNPEAQGDALARRLALDLTGLPPEPGIFRIILSRGDKGGGYDRYISTLLSSTHAAEHRARYWLDAARYGDTHGMHMDNYREIWPYRDWVIRAFGSNMPFNRFVIEQLAGDLLPSPTLAQRIATGFNRCNVTTAEGGSIPEELNVRYMVNRVETTATVFLGLTAGCAACHDHKYDPISQREFYQLGAFFNNTTQPAMDGNQKDTPPVVVMPGEVFAAEWKALQKQRVSLREKLVDWKSANEGQWKARPREMVHPVPQKDLILMLPLTEGEGDPFLLPETARWADEHPAGRRGVRFDAATGFEVPLYGQLHSHGPFTVSFWFRTPDKLVDTRIFGQNVKGQGGWSVSCSTRGRLSFSITDATGKSINGLLPGDNGLRPRSWQHLCLRYSGGQSDASISILVDGRSGRLRPDAESFLDSTPLPASNIPLKIAQNIVTGGLSDIRVFQRWLSDEEVFLLARENTLNSLIKSDIDWEKLGRKEKTLYGQYYQNCHDDDYQAISRELCEMQTRHDYIYSRSTTTLVSEERPLAPRAWVLERGRYDRPLERVTPSVPKALPSMKSELPRNRLGLANWIVDANNPLTARVTVNRMWQSIFGTGLVRTSEDYGIMGEGPSHPELLDWLAVEFIESGWDINHLLRLIVNSATYRQDARISKAKLAIDPENRLLSRGPRFRLDAEVLRDQALAISGLLTREIGGPSVRPYQPSGLWKVVAIPGSNTGLFRQDSGASLYRRSLYTFWKRTSPPPAMSAFDTPTREECRVRRERTNTPLQALILMSDPQFVEAARNFAQNAIQGEKDTRKRVTWMLRNALYRKPTDADVTELVFTANAFLELYERAPDAASALIITGDSEPPSGNAPAELAAWTMIANTIMNRDDFLNKD